MNDVYVWLWTILIFSSILWYGLLLFLVGGKGGVEIFQMIRALNKQHSDRDH